MYIVSEIYERIVEETPNYLPEIGGILGGYNGVICCVVFDHGTQKQNIRKCHYTPDTEYLNRCIEDWENNEIDFYGIFHTHFFSVATLSGGDKRYMERIMQSMPNEKNELYFPVIVLPERKMVSYLCKRNAGKIEITEDRIHLVRTL